MAGVARVHQLGPCARVRLPPPGRRRTDFFHGALRKTHGAAHWDGSSSSPRNLTLLVGRRTTPRKTGGDVAVGPPLAEPPPRVANHTCDGDEAATKTRKAEAGEGDRRRKAGQSVY
jgi:hypothetical protein